MYSYIYAEFPVILDGGKKVPLLLLLGYSSLTLTSAREIFFCFFEGRLDIIYARGGRERDTRQERSCLLGGRMSVSFLLHAISSLLY